MHSPKRYLNEHIWSLSVQNTLSETRIYKRWAPASLLCGSPPAEANHTICPSWFFVRSKITVCWEYYIGSASLSSDLDGWQVSLWQVMVSYWHSCTFISWEKLRELPHFIFLLKLKLQDSKLMLKLYYLRVQTSLLISCDENVALDSRLCLGEWNLKLTTPNWKKKSEEETF